MSLLSFIIMANKLSFIENYFHCQTYMERFIENYFLCQTYMEKKL